jgi:hypothetical protein
MYWFPLSNSLERGSGGEVNTVNYQLRSMTP